ncbi:MAG: FecR family protein [Candidatus Heimdallarchaeota archaeon]
MTKHTLLNLIQDNCSSEEKSEVLEWMVSKDFEKDLEQFIHDDLSIELAVDHNLEKTDLNHLVEDILLKVKDIKSRSRNPIPTHDEIELYNEQKNKQSWFYTMSKIAAAVILVVSFVFIANYFSSNQNEQQLAVNTIIKENLRGHKSTIFLKDGSMVYLNSESKIEFPEVFSDTLRMVHLEGEAYFDIARDENKPFIVQTGGLQIKVLGTSFNIRAFQDLDDINVSLNSGLVEVSNFLMQTNGQKIKLNPGQSVSYMSKQNRFTKIFAFDHDLDLAWKDGNLVFRDADMNAVFNSLERWYGVDISLQNKPYFKWGYTGNFENQTLHNVLELLSFSQNFDFKLNQNQVNIKFKSN